MIFSLSAGRDSSPDLRARLALDDSGQRSFLERPHVGLRELAVLSTCHRTEIYATAEGAESDAVHAMATLFPGLQASDHSELRFMRGSQAIEHLFRVACGLDSLMIGESQILGQVRRSYVLAREAGTSGPVLSNVFSRAIRLGRRARSETMLGTYASSIGALTAEHLGEWFGGLDGRSGAIVGAGAAAHDAAGSLRAAGARLAVLSRTPASASSLATTFDATSHPLEAMPEVFERSDFAVVAISGGVMVNQAQVRARGSRSPLVMVDLSVPRAVDIAGRPDVDVRNLEDLRPPGRPEIAPSVVDVEAMVREAVADLEQWASDRDSRRSAGELRSHAEEIVRAEAARALAGMELSEQDSERISALAMRIANKLMHGPTVALRDGDSETRALIQRIFGLDR